MNLTNATEESFTATRSNPMRWRILLLLMALCFISHFNRASMASAGDERIMKQFGISTEQMGVVYSAFLIVYAFFMIPGGLLIDRVGPRLALTLMGFGTAVFCALTGMVGWGLVAATQVWFTLLAIRSLMGLFTTPLHPACARSVSNWFPEQQRSLANGLVTGAALLAYAFVHPLFGALIDRVDWPGAFLISAAGTVLLTWLWRSKATDRPEQNDSEADAATASALTSNQGNPILSNIRQHEASPIIVAGNLRVLLHNRSLILLTLSYAAVGYFQYLFFYWMHYYFDEVLRLGKAESRFYAGLPNFAMALCMPLGGWLSDEAQKLFGQRTGLTLVPKVGMMASAALLLLGIFSNQTFWIVTLFTLSLGVLGLCEGSFWTAAVLLGGRRGGTAAAVMNTGGNGIGLLAPMVTPWVGERLGWTWGISLGALVGLAGALCWWWVDPNQRDKQLDSA